MDLNIGAVFTPPEWAEFAVEKYGLLDAWLGGKTVFDPAMGEGNLLAALIEKALKKGLSLSDLPMSNLYGNEINDSYYTKALDRFSEDYGVDMKNNFFNKDIFDIDNFSVDILFGNPPWNNFVDLPSPYKEKIKPLFHKYGLVENAKKLLLGGSRIDISALITQKTIIENLNENGEAVFFLPLSLFLNGGAHFAFRKFSVNNIMYSLKSIYDFENIEVFPNIGTRYGLAAFKKNQNAKKNKVIPYYRFENNKWKQYKGVSQKEGSPLIITAESRLRIPRIAAYPDQKPRQGINPCGAITVFVFTKYENINEKMCMLNGINALPKKYVYPLITSKDFNLFDNNNPPCKWILLPYNTLTGKPLSASELYGEPELSEYFEKNKSVLINRKGVLIQSYIKRGVWWALLGAGLYSFSPYKIVWEAYGKKDFSPKIFDGNWQANQSLQAFIPCSNRTDAERLLVKLREPAVERYVRSSRMEGTMSWAQPGKIASIMVFKNNNESLFTEA